MSQGLGAYGRGRGQDMWQGVGAYGRVWALVAGWVYVTRARGIWQGEGLGHVAGPRDMLQGVGASSRGWWLVAGCGLMWQGVGACHKG